MNKRTDLTSRTPAERERQTIMAKGLGALAGDLVDELGRDATEDALISLNALIAMATTLRIDLGGLE